MTHTAGRLITGVLAAVGVVAAFTVMLTAHPGPSQSSREAKLLLRVQTRAAESHLPRAGG
jgi:hypothetical protein